MDFERILNIKGQDNHSDSEASSAESQCTDARRWNKLRGPDVYLLSHFSHV